MSNQRNFNSFNNFGFSSDTESQFKSKAYNEQNLLENNFPNKKKNKKNKTNIKDLNSNEIDNLCEEILCPNCLKKTKRQAKEKEIISITKNITCENCKEVLFYINCLYCQKEIYTKYDYKLGLNLKCPYIECNGEFAYTSCGGCKRYVAIKGKYLEGNPVKCPYEDCQVSSSVITCPNPICETPNYFEKCKYFEGYSIKCINFNCNQTFSKLNCNSCFRRFFLKEKESRLFFEGKNIKCPHSECQKIFNKFYCPTCNRINIFENSSYKKICEKNFNSFVCSYEDCLQSFVKIFCPKCLFMNVYIGRNNLEGKIIECENANCKYRFNFYYCIACENLNIWESIKTH